MNRIANFINFSLIAVLLVNCSEDKKSDAANKTYSFTAPATTKLSGSKLSLLNLEDGQTALASSTQTLCDTGGTLTCVKPTNVTGKYFAAGLQLQAGGSSIETYLIAKNYSDIVASTSTQYSFDFKTPVSTTGELICCNGSGDLSSSNTYFSSGVFLFAYLDFTFTAPTGVGSAAAGSHTVRFVLATDSISTYKRGDLLLKDTDGTFKWMDSNGVLSTTRPTSPITMNSKVVDWTNTNTGGNQSIPALYTQIFAPGATDDGTKVTASEDSLKQSGKKYSFDFEASTMLVIMLASSELSSIQTKAALLSKLHLQGLPHTNFTFGAFSAASTLVVE